MTLADRLVILEDGRTTQAGTPAEVRQAPRSSYVADLVGLNLYTGRLEPFDEGAGRFVTDGGDLIVAWPTGATRKVTEGVTATLRPADVVLHTSRPEGGSARNVLHGPVAAVSVDGERARVRVASAPPVVAESHARFGEPPGPAGGCRGLGELQGRRAGAATARLKRASAPDPGYPCRVKTTSGRESLEAPEPATTPPKKRNPVLQFIGELPGLILMAFILALLIKTFLVQAFFIPSGSMEPTLMPGDRVLVLKVPYYFHDPRRGDIIVFEDPEPQAAARPERDRRVLPLDVPGARRAEARERGLHQAGDRLTRGCGVGARRERLRQRPTHRRAVPNESERRTSGPTTVPTAPCS